MVAADDSIEVNRVTGWGEPEYVGMLAFAALLVLLGCLERIMELRSAQRPKAVALTSAKAAAPAKVTAVSPQKGPLTTEAKIFGSGLSNGTTGIGDPPDVTFGGLAATVLRNWTDTLVHVALPQNLPPGTADVQVITSDGRTATLPNAFERTP